MAAIKGAWTCDEEEITRLPMMMIYALTQTVAYMRESVTYTRKRGDEMRRTFELDEWEMGERVANMWATGLRARAIARKLMPEVVALCRQQGREAPNLQSVTAKVDRYMRVDPADRRSKQARNQKAVQKLEVEAASKMLKAQVDAAETLQQYVNRIDCEVQRLEQTVHHTDEQYYPSLIGLSKEMRGWISLLVDIKDRMWQHEQYEKAFAAILMAVRDECPEPILRAIQERLQADPHVSAALKYMGGGDHVT